MPSSHRPSPANSMCFCTGSLGVQPDNDLPAIARRFADRIHFVHLRATKRDADGLSFHEADHLDGDVDEVEVIRALLEEDRRRPDAPASRSSRTRHRMLDDLGEGKRVNPGYTPSGASRASPNCAASCGRWSAGRMIPVPVSVDVIPVSLQEAQFSLEVAIQRQSAVGIDRLSGDVAGLVRCQEGVDRHDLLRRRRVAPGMCRSTPARCSRSLRHASFIS